VYASTLIRWSGLAAVVAGVLFLIVELLELLAIDLENLGAQATMGIFFCGLYSYQSEAAGVLGLAGFLAAFLGTALAFAPPGVQPAAVGAVRIALGGLALLVLAALRGELRSGVGWPPLATTTAAVGIAAYQPFFFAGVARTGVALGTIVAIGSTPVWAGAIGFLFRGEKPTVRWGIATALAVSGCALLLLDARGGVSVAAAGILFALAAGACYGAYATASKRLLTEVWTAGSS
jgi:DME family drug/metabolite transporter